MSAMADLDIKLSEYKLSDAQKNAVLELMDGAFTNAKPNTIKSLENKGIIQHEEGGGWGFTNEFASALVLFMADNALTLSAVKADLDGGEVGDKADSVEDVKLQAEVYNHMYANWEKELCGFGATVEWNNSEVWDGLTAEEIRKDMDTAGPINRAARRKAQKITRRFMKAMTRAGL